MAPSTHDNRTYEVLPYDPVWANRFVEEANIVRSIFGDDARSIAHIGSTAVSGCAGKPVIDVLVLVDDIATADQLQEKMEHVGYHARGDYLQKGSRLFSRESNGVRNANVHVFEEGHPHVQEMIRVRDFLRTHPDVVQEYSALKFDLAQQYPTDYGQYRKYKDAWMKQLIASVMGQSSQ